MDLCLREIAHSAEEGCDGYVLLTNGHGHYLGDPIFDPIFDELNRRKATLFVHPTTPCVKCQPESVQRGPMNAAPFGGKYPNPMQEFLFDTARVACNLFLSGTMERCPDLKIILPHLGGAMPPMLSRFTLFSSLIPGPWTKVSEDEARETFNKQFFFDLAGVPFPGQIVGLVKGSGVSHERLIFGSDYPYTSAAGVAHLLNEMDERMHETFSEEEVENMYHKNAEKLLSHGIER